MTLRRCSGGRGFGGRATVVGRITARLFLERLIVGRQTLISNEPPSCVPPNRSVPAQTPPSTATSEPFESPRPQPPLDGRPRRDRRAEGDGRRRALARPVPIQEEHRVGGRASRFLAVSARSLGPTVQDSADPQRLGGTQPADRHSILVPSASDRASPRSRVRRRRKACSVC